MRRPVRLCREKSKTAHDGAACSQITEDPGSVHTEAAMQTLFGDVGDGKGDIGSDEFQEPIMLDGIPQDLQQKMYVVAPMLKGREGVYDERFFTLVCGLCDHGVEVDQVQTLAAVSDAEILTKWSPSSDKYRFPIDKCVDQDQAAQFCEHYRLVYGGHPCNSSFSLRFLRACFATFVHKREVDWVVEAVRRRRIRMGTKKLNRHKLGPVAMREQLACLCAIVASYKVTTVGKKRSMKHPKSQRDQAIHEVEAVLRDSYKLQEEALAVQDDLLRTVIKLKEGLLGSGETMSAVQEEYNATAAAANELKRKGSNQLSAQKWREGRDLLEKLLAMSDEQQKTNESILVIEEDKLPKAAKVAEQAASAVTAAKEKLQNLENFTLMLQTRAPFLYPTGTSLPELPVESKLKLCAGCGKHGFVACAIVVGSCGCGFHPTCIAVLLQLKRPSCPRCGTSFSGAWMAQFGFPLTAEMEEDVSNMKKSLEATAGGNSSLLDALLKELQLKTSELQQFASALDEKKLAHTGLQARILALETEDERLNSMKDDLRKRSKQFATAGELQEKADVDKEQREISKAIAANIDALEAAQEEAAKLASILEHDSSAYQSSQQQLRQLEKKCGQ